MTTAPPATAAQTLPQPEPALAMVGISKAFPGVQALSEVTFTVVPGEVHALLGENGAGKSTLMAIASGALAQDAGSVAIGGVSLTSASPHGARKLGLGIVRQHPALLPDLTVAENMAIGIGYDEAGSFGRAPAWAQALLDPWQMGISARDRVSELSVEQRFIVEIAKAVALKPAVLVLDEPTEHLSEEESEGLFARVRELTSAGSAIVYISHRIPEVLRIADRITVMRDGHVRGTRPAAGVTEDQIVELVVGRALETVFPPKAQLAPDAAPHLVVERLSGPGFAGIDLQVAPGEIVGLAGVQGNGQEELVRALAGVGAARGTVRVAGESVPTGNAPAAASAGIAFVPADRHHEGLFMPLSVGENVVMKSLRSVSRLGIVSEKQVRATAHGQINELGIKTPSSRTAVENLSGGNQQKVVLARTLLANPSVIIAEEPTQGVDAGARVDIYRLLRQAADDGAAVLILSSDGVELEGLCDRALIMSRGAIVAELTGEDVTEAEIARAALTSTSVRARERDADSVKARMRRLLAGDQTPTAVLGALVIVFAIAVGAMNSAYFSPFAITNLLTIAAPLILVGAAQLVVVLGSGFDLSIGPLMGLLVVIGSFFPTSGLDLVLGIAAMAATALAVGLINGFVIARFDLSPVVVTLAMSLALQGAFLLLRPTPGGSMPVEAAIAIESSIGFLPVATVVAVAVALGLQWLLRRSRWGVELRAVGSHREAADSLGIKSRRLHLTSYVFCSLLTVPAALLLLAQIGIGDGRTGLPFTFNAVTVVVLAGAAIAGGRGSFAAIAVAAILVAQVLGLPAFLGLSGAWGYALPGAITILAAVLYSRLRVPRRS